MKIPKRRKGRQSAQSESMYQEELQEFAQNLKILDRQIDFKVSSRGWCYILEEHGLLKGDFDYAQRLINFCRKDGLLPIDFTVEDQARVASGIEYTFTSGTESYCEAVWHELERYIESYKPVSFWDYQDVYLELAVEKIDLVGLFRPIANQFNIPITNFRGWSDINSRAAMLQRFSEWERKGKTCVLLYCGDHDPGGLNISESIRSNFQDLEAVVNIPNVSIDRFGLNYDFIMTNNLSWVENLETSSGKRLDSPSHKDYLKSYVQNYLTEFGARKVEANALVVRVDEGRKLFQEEAEKYLDLEAINQYEADLEDFRDEVRDAFTQFVAKKAA